MNLFPDHFALNGDLQEVVDDVVEGMRHKLKKEQKTFKLDSYKKQSNVCILLFYLF